MEATVTKETVIRRQNRLRELREAEGLTQSELARRLAIKVTTLNRHEQMNRSIDALSIERYARYFNVHPYELFVPEDHELEYEPASEDADGL